MNELLDKQQDVIMINHYEKKESQKKNATI